MAEREEDGGPGGSSRRAEQRTHLGRFDRSFFVRMIGSFLVLLVVVALAELGLRFGLQLREFYSDGPARAETTARQLAADVRSIMINEGGPVASRAVYPILDRAYERAGLRIAVEPSQATIESIRETFGFRPRGVPAVFPEGRHHEERVELRAESFCLRCHVTASVGDVLGTVVVRDYLSATLSGWWRDVRLSATVNAAKILIHVAILFFLLRVLMEPLLSLRGVVARLADGTGGIANRAQVRSDDEFGELAHDLNAFLDRIDGLLSELRRVLSGTVRTGEALAGSTEDAREQLDAMEAALEPMLGYGSAGAGLAGDGVADAGLADGRRELPRLVAAVHELRHTVQRQGFLHRELTAVVETGDALLARLDVRERSDHEC